MRVAFSVVVEGDQGRLDFDDDDDDDDDDDEDDDDDVPTSCM